MLLNSFLCIHSRNHTGKALTGIIARDAGEMHERKVMQNLSNATTKIQLNSRPERKKLLNVKLFFSYLGNARSDTEKKKTWNFILNLPSPSPASRVLVLLFLHASFFPVVSDFSTFLSLLYEVSFFLLLKSAAFTWCEVRKHTDISSLRFTQTRGKSGANEDGWVMVEVT